MKNTVLKSKTARKPPQRARSRMRHVSVPASYSSSFTTFSQIKQNKDGSARISCREVFEFAGQSTGLAFMLPANPTKWVGTRTQTLSSAYTSFRPVRCKLTYIPVVGTATAGLVSVGTIFDGSRLDTGDYTLNLAATNGGFATTVWARASNRVSLGTNLRANTFPLYDVQDDDIPFWIVARSTVQAMLLIEMEFILHNPTLSPMKPFAVLATVDGSNSGTEYTLTFEDHSGLFAKDMPLAVKLGASIDGLVPAMKTLFGKVVNVANNIISFTINGITGTAIPALLAFFFLRDSYPADPTL